jgi:hypothetical protein
MSELMIPAPHSLWRYKHNHNAIYEVDYCMRYTVRYRIFRSDNNRVFLLDLDSWLQQYKPLTIDETTAETGIF